MQDLEIFLDHQPGALALLGETLGRNGISLEGGGVFTHGDLVLAHFLVADGVQAKEVLGQAGFQVGRVRQVLITRLQQEVPGQLGAVCRLLAEAGLQIETQYSDHSNQLILIVDQPETAREILQAHGFATASFSS